jgi:biopolymer transport protein ExbD
MRFKTRHEIKRTKIEIIPMIDTMFFLLVFFMLSSLALTRLNGLPVNLPQASTAQRQATNDITLTIDDKSQVYVNKDHVDISDVPNKIVEKAGPGADLSKTSVVINADLSVQHGLVVRALDECRTVGITRFAIATKPDEGVAKG